MGHLDPAYTFLWPYAPCIIRIAITQWLSRVLKVVSTMWSRSSLPYLLNISASLWSQRICSLWDSQAADSELRGILFWCFASLLRWKLFALRVLLVREDFSLFETEPQPANTVSSSCRQYVWYFALFWSCSAVTVVIYNFDFCSFFSLTNKTSHIFLVLTIATVCVVKNKYSRLLHTWCALFRNRAVNIFLVFRDIRLSKVSLCVNTIPSIQQPGR